jgi:hypothetical protein
MITLPRPSTSPLPRPIMTNNNLPNLNINNSTNNNNNPLLLSPGNILSANKKARLNRRFMILVISAFMFLLFGIIRSILEMWGTTIRGTTTKSNNNNNLGIITTNNNPDTDIDQNSKLIQIDPLITSSSSPLISLSPIPIHEPAHQQPTTVSSSSWTSLSWIQDPTLLPSIIKLQQAFRSSPNKTAFRPQPLIYRPILKGMGWGNFIYDISYHVAFASWLQRPIIMLLDRKDADGCLGWDPKSPEGYSFLEPNLIDWRYYREDGYNLDHMARVQNSVGHVQLTCRPENQWHALCGGNYEGSWDGPYDRLIQIPEKVLYSEYSASFIFPLSRSQRYNNWLKTRIIPAPASNNKRKSSKNIPFAYQLRYAFNLIFRIAPKFHQEQIEPHLKKLGSNYLACHIRTGHHETGYRRTSELKDDVEAIKSCLKAFPQDREWLVLTDDAKLAQEVRSLAHTTVDETFSLAQLHVGNGESAARRDAWSHTLRDWLLLVYAPGPVLLRSRISSAFSFGERSSLLGGKICKKPIMAGSIMSCGNSFFDNYCENEDEEEGGLGRVMLKLLL